MERILLNLLNRMFLYCKINHGDPVRLEAILNHYLDIDCNAIKLIDNHLQAKYNNVIIDFALNENDCIYNIKISEIPENLFW